MTRDRIEKAVAEVLRCPHAVKMQCEEYREMYGTLGCFAGLRPAVVELAEKLVKEQVAEETRELTNALECAYIPLGFIVRGEIYRDVERGLLAGATAAYEKVCAALGRQEEPKS